MLLAPVLHPRILMRIGIVVQPLPGRRQPVPAATTGVLVELHDCAYSMNATAAELGMTRASGNGEANDRSKTPSCPASGVRDKARWPLQPKHTLHAGSVRRRVRQVSRHAQQPRRRYVA